MKLRAGGNYSMEALALVSALCIVGIFVFSHFNRQMDTFDQKAGRVARAVPAAVALVFQKDPQAKISVEALKGAGLSWQPPIEVAVSQDRDAKDNWQVKVWHTEGVELFLADQAGVKSSPR